MRDRIWQLLSFGFVVVIALDAAPARYYLHREPSLFITSIAETREGALWIASHEGLFRFDGFHFEKVGMPNLAVPREIAVAADGALWIGSEEGLFRLRDQKFDVVYNVQARQVVTVRDGVLFRSGTGLWRRVGSGQLELMQMCKNGAPLRPILPSLPQVYYLVNGSGTEICRVPASGKPESRTIPGDWFRAVVDRRQDWWLENRGRALFRVLHGETVARAQPMPPYVDLYQGRLLSDPTGSAWLLGNPTLNLTEGYALERGRDQHRITHLAAGMGRNIWIAERQIGLVEYKPSEQWEQWTSDRAGASGFQLLKGMNSQVVIYGSRGLMRMANGTLLPRSAGTPAVQHLFELRDGKWLGILPDDGIALLAADGQVIQRIHHPVGDGLDQAAWPKLYRMTRQDGQSRIWVAADSHALLLELERTNPRLKYSPVWHEKEEEIGVEDIQIDAKGRPWIGHRQGLSYREDNRWVSVATEVPLGDVLRFELRVDEIWVARKNPGAFARLRRNGAKWAVEDFRPEAGFGPNRTHWLRVDSRGWIWRAVDDGVRVSNGKNLKDWLYLKEENGLDVGTPSPQGFLEDKDRSIWIAGERGVAHFMPDAKWFEVPQNAPPPLITKLTATGRHIQAWVGGLHMPEFREAPLEYRLLPLFDDWRGTKNGTLDFLDLRDNDYRLEVRYAGIGVSPVTSRVIQIGRGAWRFPWTAAGGGVGTLGLAWLLLRNTGFYRKLTYRLEKRMFLMRAEPRAELEPGAVVDERFEVVKPVAHGGFSIVYEARDRETAERVALKVMGPRSQDESWVRNRFSHEQNALRAIAHPNVVRLRDAGVGPDGLLYLAMPFLEGPSLRQNLQSGPLTPAATVTILRQLAGALEAAHRKGIVHLDFKPENVILTSQGAQLIDFGTSGLRGPEDDMAVTKMLSGSAFYMAPERLTGHYSTASDVYAFGLVAQEMLTGKKLSDYRTPSFQVGFLPEFAAALEPVAGEKSRELAAHLAQAFEVEPRKRPVKLREWVEDMAGLMIGNQ
jgi:ligand-binding sensor domain-containing protein